MFLLLFGGFLFLAHVGFHLLSFFELFESVLLGLFSRVAQAIAKAEFHFHSLLFFLL